MKKNIIEIIKNTHFLYPFLLLSLIFIFSNGIIYVIGKYLHNIIIAYLNNSAFLREFYDIISWFSKPIYFCANFGENILKTQTSDIQPQLFIALITIFILFFSFAQFSLSRALIPQEIIETYIIRNKKTSNFIGYHSGAGIILAFFTLISESTNNLNLGFSVILVLTSFFYSIVYFFWIIKNTTPVGIFNIIKNTLNLDEINKLEKELYKSRENFIKDCNKDYMGIDVDIKREFLFVLPEHLQIKARKSGIIKSIDLKGIRETLDKYKGCFNKLYIDVMVGDYITSQQSLLRVRCDLIKWREFNELRKEILPLEQEKLRNYFVYQNENNPYNEALYHLNNMLNYFFAVMEKDVDEAYKLLDSFINFIIEWTKNISVEDDTNSENSLTEDLFLKFIQIMNKRLSTNAINEQKLEIMIYFIYYFKHIPQKYNSFNLISELLDLLQLLFYRIITESDQYNSRLSFLLLSVREISFTIYAHEDENSKNNLPDNDKDKGLNLIYKTINTSTILFYLMIKYFHKRNKWDNYNIILSNSQYFISLLEPLYYGHYPKSAFQKNQKEIIRYFAKNVLYISILSYSELKKGKLPQWIIHEVIFPLCDNCNTYWWSEANSAIDLLNDIFFHLEFTDVYKSFLSEEFEINKIHKAGAYSPEIMDFDEFWFIFSLYCHTKHKTDFPFYRNLKSISDDDKIRISKYRSKVKNYDKNFIMELLNINSDTYISYFNYLYGLTREK